jgi:hypothetical protein|tara:strand:+ start:744 stop:971 length:228 start_codon:yes stop_codon:yes gene_type:complete
MNFLQIDRETALDLGERCAATFIQVFAATIAAASFTELDISILESALTAGVGSVLSILKSFAATKMGDGSASIVK